MLMFEVELMIKIIRHVAPQHLLRRWCVYTPCPSLPSIGKGFFVPLGENASVLLIRLLVVRGLQCLHERFGPAAPSQATGRLCTGCV